MSNDRLFLYSWVITSFGAVPRPINARTKKSNSDTCDSMSLMMSLTVYLQPEESTANTLFVFFFNLARYQHRLEIPYHYNDVIMGAIASQIASLTIVYSTVYSDADERKHQSSASLAFVWGIHRWPVNSPHKWPVTRKMFPFDDVIMFCHITPYFTVEDFRVQFGVPAVSYIYGCHVTRGVLGYVPYQKGVIQGHWS